MTHGPWLQRTHNLLGNTLHKQITSRPQTFTKCLPWAMKHQAGRWTRQYVIIDHLIILHGSAQTAQLWAESINRAVGWDRRMLHGLPTTPEHYCLLNVAILFWNRSWSGFLTTGDLKKSPPEWCLLRSSCLPEMNQYQPYPLLPQTHAGLAEKVIWWHDLVLHSTQAATA